MAAQLAGRISAWLRLSAALLVRLVRDDGAVVYLNGREIMRSNMPAGTVDQTTKALASAGTEKFEKVEAGDWGVWFAGDGVVEL